MSTSNLPVIQSVHSADAKRYDTQTLRERFLITGLEEKDNFNLTYTHYDRLISGTVIPTKKIQLGSYVNLKSETFFERREAGVINVGGSGKITVDGTVYNLNKLDCLYIGRGVKEVYFESDDANAPSLFYILSTPAHAVHPVTLVTSKDATPVTLGSAETSNERTIYKYIHLDGAKSCQLVMGLTTLAKGSVWNTMPSHVHDRRCEVYFYFDVPQDQRIFHFMGEPSETRHIVMKNYEAVASPAWSIHSGCGTSNYSFIWGMGGENLDYTDMDAFPASNLF